MFKSSLCTEGRQIFKFSIWISLKMRKKLINFIFVMLIYIMTIVLRFEFYQSVIILIITCIAVLVKDIKEILLRK